MTLNDREAAKRALQTRLDEPHMRPLKHYVRLLEAELKVRLGDDVTVPDFDPRDGGVEARCLFLLESPGRRARHSGFISRNNPDPTARNWLTFNEAAGIERTMTAMWNVVPWYVGEDRRIHAIQSQHVLAALPELINLLALFAKLEVIVLVGKNAALSRPFIEKISPHLTVLECPHPSAKGIAFRPESASRIEETLIEVSRLLGEGPRDGSVTERVGMPYRHLTRLTYLESSSFKHPTGLRIDFRMYPDQEATSSVYRPGSPGDEPIEAPVSSLARDIAEAIRQMACRLQLPLVAQELSGLDGTCYRLELESGMHSCVLAWWNELPHAWQQAKPLIDMVQDLLARKAKISIDRFDE